MAILIMDVTCILHDITFIWDKKKADVNVKKHGVSFQEACESFFDPFLKVVDASRNLESRDAIIGYSKKRQLLFVVYKEHKQDAFRVISARKVTRAERDYYENI